MRNFLRGISPVSLQETIRFTFFAEDYRGQTMTRALGWIRSIAGFLGQFVPRSCFSLNFGLQVKTRDGAQVNARLKIDAETGPALNPPAHGARRGNPR
jgi:hypothetical protein